MRSAISYILPLRSAEPVDADLISYVGWLSNEVEVIVVDGSESRVFDDFGARCTQKVRHLRIDPDLRGLSNGKVAGVLTGVRRASFERLIIADDDVRYDRRGMQEIADELDRAEIVRPQNYFDPLPWHAALDSARSLINRVSGGDWPGTFAVRRSVLQRSGGYHGNVMFENLELVRTVRAVGGRERLAQGLFVRRLPPEPRHFLSQRVRQAYDEFARPARMVLWLSLLPLAFCLRAVAPRAAAAALLFTPMLVAEAGRRVAHGRTVFPWPVTLVAPLWVLERAVCAWLACGSRVLLGGIPYRGGILRTAATPARTLARRYAARGASTSRRLPTNADQVS